MLGESTSTVEAAPAVGTSVKTLAENSSQATSCGNSQNQVQTNTQNTLLGGIVEDLPDNNPTSFHGNDQDNDQNVVSNSAQSGPCKVFNQTEIKTEPRTENQLLPQPIFSYSDVHTRELEQLFEGSLPTSRLASRRNSIQVENIEAKIQQNESRNQ